eukprot:11182821-Lingulodinium_polyedra.AAC.1
MRRASAGCSRRQARAADARRPAAVPPSPPVPAPPEGELVDAQPADIPGLAPKHSGPPEMCAIHAGQDGWERPYCRKGGRYADQHHYASENRRKWVQ